MPIRPLKVGLIGGGAGAFIAHPHQRAIHFDGTRRVTAAALHGDPAIAMSEAEKWAYPIQGYPSYAEMIATEVKKPVGERIDYAVVVTPNHVHYDPARLCLENGIPVMCEKPLTVNLEEADKLVALAKEKNVPFCTAHTYLGHWTTRLTRHIVRSGLLGEVRYVDVRYLQGWLSERTEDKGVQQAEWRTDPKRSGISGCGGDIGTHSLMQLRYCTGLEPKRVSAHLETFLPSRRLDDHFTAYLELNNGARALIRCSQIAIGHKNDLGIEITGSKAALTWNQEDSERLVIQQPGKPDLHYFRGEVKPNDGFIKDLPADLMAELTLPSGHIEGLHSAFARLHRSFEQDVRNYLAGKPFTKDGSKYASVEDGRMGIYFLTKALESSSRGGAWIDM